MHLFFFFSDLLTRNQTKNTNIDYVCLLKKISINSQYNYFDIDLSDSNNINLPPIANNVIYNNNDRDVNNSSRSSKNSCSPSNRNKNKKRPKW